MTAHTFRQMTRVVCLFCICASAVSLSAQPKRVRPAPEYVQVGKPDQQEGAKILREFQAHGLYSGQNYIEFEFLIMPRRGDEKPCKDGCGAAARRPDRFRDSFFFPGKPRASFVFSCKAEPNQRLGNGASQRPQSKKWIQRLSSNLWRRAT